MTSIVDSSIDTERAWYVVHTKPRQETRALENLENQGFECFLPRIPVQKRIRQRVQVVSEPLFSRYLFIRLDQSTRSWAPIRSTLGVSRLVTFGQQPARVPEALVAALREAPPMQVAHLFAPGDAVLVVNGPLQGAQGVYQVSEGEQRALVLIELLGQPQRLQLMLDDLCRVLD